MRNIKKLSVLITLVSLAMFTATPLMANGVDITVDLIADGGNEF